MAYFLPFFSGGSLATEAPPLPAANSSPPTATPAWPEPPAGLSSSKLGLHVVRNSDPDIMEFVRHVHPRVIKAVDDVGWLADVKAISPQTITLGRLSGQEESWVDTSDPVGAAQAYVLANLERYRLNPGVDYWEGWNEFVPQNATRMSWYAQFEATRACLMQSYGLRAAVGSFSTGVPEYALMEFFLPALEAARRCGGIFTLHEYNSPDLQCGVSVNAPHIIPDAPVIPNLPVGYHTLRYRFWYAGYLQPRGWQDLPLVISEVGIAGGPAGGPCNDPGSTRGWRGYQDWWVAHNIGADGPQAYVNVLAWYDAELRRDPYVLGATIFTAGAISDWEDFDIHPLLLPLAIYAAQTQ